MEIPIFIDNNCWDLFFELKLDLNLELPRNEFHIAITREAEFEIKAIPENKSELKNYITNTLSNHRITTDSLFGFYTEGVPQNEQRYSGFNQGRFSSSEENAFCVQQNHKIGKLRNSKLYANEADIAIAARSTRYIILTLDKKAGPIRDAAKQGGKVVFLTDFREGTMSLREFILTRIAPSESRELG